MQDLISSARAAGPATRSLRDIPAKSTVNSPASLVEAQTPTNAHPAMSAISITQHPSHVLASLLHAVQE